MDKIWGVVKKEIQSFEDDYLEINPAFAPRQADIIELIDHYWVNRFKGGNYDSRGLRKPFLNAITNPTEVAAKMIDFDTKDVQVIAEDGQSYYPAWFFGKELKIWMKDEKNKDGQTFGQFLNTIVYNFPKYGHVLVKKAKNTVFMVPLQNIYNRQDAKSILTSDIILEKHEMTPYELRQQEWDKDKIEYVIEKYSDDDSKNKITIWEIVGDCGHPKGYNYLIMPEKGEDDEILFEAKKDRNDIYKEIKWDDIPARAMGRGVVERLFEAQIAKNQTEYMLRDGLRWSSKHIFQSRDNTLAKNLISEIENGEILPILSEISAVPVEERNLNAYGFADSKWDKNVQDMTFAYEVMTGKEQQPNTPLGTTILQSKMSGQYYDLKREELGMFIKGILYDWILPGFAKQKKDKHSILVGEFNEDELTKLRKLVLTNRLNKEIVKKIKKKKRVPNMKEIEILKAITQEQLSKSREIEIPKDFYKNLKYKLDIVLTNEQIDIASRITTIQMIMQIIGSNPMVMKDPKTRKMMNKLIDLAGISPTEFDDADEESGGLDQMAAQLGGSIAKAPNQTLPQGAQLPQRL